MTIAVATTAGPGVFRTIHPRRESELERRTTRSGAQHASGGEGWQLHWRPPNGGTVRRLTVSRRVALGLVLVLAVASSAVAAGGLSAGLERGRVRAEIAAAKQESRNLRARQTALRSTFLEQREQSVSVESGERHRRRNQPPAER